jgi:hypothetical protein
MKTKKKTARARELRSLGEGSRVLITGNHPWATHSGTLLRYEKYGVLGWWGWRVKLDSGQETYASMNEVRNAL